MADRGRLFYASDGLLWEVDPTASISGEPAQADLQPVRMGELAGEVIELDQQADDGTDRVFIRGSDGAIKAEVFFDGTNTVINPLTGSVDVQGALAADKLNNADFTTATDGEVLTKTATGSQAAWEAAPGGATTFIEAQSPSGVSTADFTTGIDSDHKRYIFEISDLVPASDSVDLEIQVSTDGGSTWESGASDYAWANRFVSSSSTTSGGDQASAGDSSIELTAAVGSESGEGAAATVRLSNPANGSLKQIIYHETAIVDSGGDTTRRMGQGTYLTASAIDGIRFKFSSGNIESGTIELIGVN